MFLEKRNNTGFIKINDTVFGSVVSDALLKTGTKAWPATDKAKLVTGIAGIWPSAAEIADHLILSEEEGVTCIRVHIIMAFGTSIKMATDIILDYMEEKLKTMLPDVPCRVIIDIVGVKSKYIAPRDVEVIREWN